MSVTLDATDRKKEVNMRKKPLLVLTAIFLIVIAAVVVLRPDVEVVQETYVFTGESDNWAARLQVDTEIIWTEANDGRLSHESASERLFTIQYKGDLSQVSHINDITIAYDSVGGGGSAITREGPIEQTYTISSTSANTGLVGAYSEILVTVTLGEEVEEFYLYNTEQENAG